MFIFQKSNSPGTGDFLFDISEMSRLGKESNQAQIEFAGIFRTNKFQNTLTFTPQLMATGGVDSVSLPNERQTFHTHPRECNKLSDCSIIPPSADDMEIFAKRGDTNVVISKYYTYFIKRKETEPENIFENAKIVKQFYDKCEKYFDGVSKNPDIYHDIFTYGSRILNYFTIYRFNNEECLHPISKEHVENLHLDQT